MTAAPLAARSLSGFGGMDVAALARLVAANRFIPIPPSERSFVGDGDFRAIGAEFLCHFVRLGGLAPDHAVLDIGCGIGRMALPLTQYLSGTGSYDGIDVVAEGIAWCRATISPVYSNFRFHHLDVRNTLYNPGGALMAEAVHLPFGNRRFDFILMTSVLTHLTEAETRAYVREVGRLLRPGGSCFLSLFLMNEASRAGLRADRRRLPFDPDSPGPQYLADATQPASAVAYDEDFLMGLFAEAGLTPARPVLPGHWSGRRGASYQDLCVLTRQCEGTK